MTLDQGSGRRRVVLRQRLSPEARERQIIDGAIAFFAEVGLSGQTRELAQRLGVTQPLIYRYFPTKQDLIDRVYEEVFVGRWRAEWTDLIGDRARPLRDRLIAFYQVYARLFQLDRLFDGRARRHQHASLKLPHCGDERHKHECQNDPGQRVDLGLGQTDRVAVAKAQSGCKRCDAE